MSLNRGMVIGNLGGDPELRYLPTGQPAVGFSIATWIRCHLWGGFAIFHRRCFGEYLRAESKQRVASPLEDREPVTSLGSRVLSFKEGKHLARRDNRLCQWRGSQNPASLCPLLQIEDGIAIPVFGAQSHGLPSRSPRFVGWITPPPRKTRFRMAGQPSGRD
jgi:hypothetical protein